jgi:transposase-like protein
MISERESRPTGNQAAQSSAKNCDQRNGREIAVMAPDMARVLTDQIKTGVEAVWHLITRAYTERAWSALGHASWDDYCTREFGTTRLRLPREERAEVVASLRESGLSNRAIAAATGLNRETVMKDLHQQVAGNQPPADAEPDVEADVLAEELIAAEPAPVIGLDGKRYPKPKPKPRRRPLTETAADIARDMRVLHDRIDRLIADDRFVANRETIACRIRPHDVLLPKAVARLHESLGET